MTEEIYLSTKTPTILIGDHVVTINKLFGPIAACNVRVRIDLETYEWVFEREFLPKEGDDYFEEVARCSLQESLCIEESGKS